MALTKEDLQAIRALMQEELKPINNRLDSFEETLQTVKNSQIRVELEQFPRIAAALDGAVGGNEKNTEQDRRLEVLENKSENQGNRILALEYALKAE